MTSREPKVTESAGSAVLGNRRAPNRKSNSEEESSEEKEVADDDELVSQAAAWERQDDEVLFRVQAVLDFIAEENGDLSFKKEEVLSVLDSSRRDGWMLALNALGEKGFIPGNYVQQLEPTNQFQRGANAAHLTSTTRGHVLWAKLRAHVQQETNLADILGAMGALPSGFRESVMAKLLTDSCAHLTSTWLLPEPSSTGMAFKDLRFDHKKNEVVPMPARVSRQFTILAARMIPDCPGTGLEILSQHIRVAVISKDNILSNIHTVRAVVDTTGTHQKSWRFTDKGDSSLYQRRCVVRLSGVDNNLELVFELGITFKREKTGEIGELSCGWGSMPLFDTAGIPVPNRTYELKIHGGTPFEKGVELDSARTTRGGRHVPSVLQINRTPRLYVQMNSCGQSTKQSLNLLPITIVTSYSFVTVIPCFRQLVASSFLVGRVGLPLLGHVHRPSLNVFLRSVDQADVMDLLLLKWKEQLKEARSHKHDLGHQAQLLEKVLLECIYPMLHSTSFPAPTWADERRELDRLEYTKEASRKKDLQDELQDCLTIAEQVFSLWPTKRPS